MIERAGVHGVNGTLNESTFKEEGCLISKTNEIIIATTTRHSSVIDRGLPCRILEPKLEIMKAIPKQRLEYNVTNSVASPDVYFVGVSTF